MTSRNPIARALLSKDGQKPRIVAGKKGRAPYVRPADQRKKAAAVTEADAEHLIKYLSV